MITHRYVLHVNKPPYLHSVNIDRTQDELVYNFVYFNNVAMQVFF